MPTTFRYLTKQGRGGVAERTSDEAVESRYNRTDLIKRPVVRDELHNCYLVFESRQDLLEWYETLPEAERCCHEVIFGFRAQRLKFDIDAPAHKLDALSDRVLEAAMATATAVVTPAAMSEEVGQYIEDILGADVTDTADVTVVPPAFDDDPFCGLLDDGIVTDASSVAVSADEPIVNSAEVSRLAKIRAVMNILIEAILDELYVGYYGIEEIYPTRDDLVVTDSSGQTANGWKYSFHIIALPYAVLDNEEASEFTARVCERLPPPLRVFVDPCVNKKTQNFRLVDSMKPGTGRYKRASLETARVFGTSQETSRAGLFITASSGTRILPRVYTDGENRGRRVKARVMLGPQDSIVKAALDLAGRFGVTAGHTFSEVRGTLICFTRDVPTHCRICGETHHKDNSLLLSIDPAEGGHTGAWPGTGDVVCNIVEHCRQARGKGIAIGDLTVAAEDLRGVQGVDATTRRGAKAKKPIPLGLREKVAARIGAVREGRVNPHDALVSEFEQLPDAQKTVYVEPAMRDYELTPTLAVLAQMKLGKTKALRRYLDTHFSAESLETKVVRFVTFRQTFSRALSDAFPDFTLYNDVQGDLDHARYPRLIVQVESLHRLKMPTRPEPIDLLVLDEVESIFAQFNSGLHRHFNAAFAMFQWMLRTARHVVCMDANLGDRTYRTLLRMRPAHPPHFHWNRFARAADDTYYFTADQGAWLDKLYRTLREGKKVVLPTNSLTEAKAYEEAIRREFPAKKVMLYSSETAPSEKARHFGDVHTYWAELDVLIYTPTCSAGVSFELEHFDTLFGYFCDISCDVETCRQMLGRVRNIRTQEHYICLRATGAALPTTIDEIRRLIYDKRAGLYRSVDDAALQYEYEVDGSVKYHESDYFYLWLETVRVNNLSRNEFVHRFVDQVADTGARIELLPIDAAIIASGAALLTSHREARTDLKAARCDAVAEAIDLSPEEAVLVRESLRTQQDVDPNSLLAYEKYQLREHYAWHGRPLDSDFVADYQNAEARRVYRNLLRITEGATVLESLKLMRQREADHFTYVMESRPEAYGYINESKDLLRDKATYVFQAHFLAIWLLRLCGFRCLTDKARIHEGAIEARFRGAIPIMKKTMDRLVFEFEIPRMNLDRLAREIDRVRFIASMLRTVNAVLRTMYGVQVHRAAKRNGDYVPAYYLNQSTAGRLFVFALEPEDDNIRGGPRPHVPSKLLPMTEANHRVDLFLEETYYSQSTVPVAAVDDQSETPVDVAQCDVLESLFDEFLLDSMPNAEPAEPESESGLDEFLADQFEAITARYARTNR